MNSLRDNFKPAGYILALAGCFASGIALSQASDGMARISDVQIEKINTAVAADTKRLETIFKDIHQNPELGFMEVRTAGIIAEELTNLGFDIQTGIGETGVVGVFRNGQGPTVMYRADMDANAFEEASGLS
jgi:hippurate hydrolase